MVTSFFLLGRNDLFLEASSLFVFGSVSFELSDSLLLLLSDLLIEKSLLLEVFVTFLKDFSHLVTFLKTSFEGFDLDSIVLSNTCLVVKGSTCGLKSLNLDIFVLIFDLLSVHLLDDSDLSHCSQMLVSVIMTSITQIRSNIAISIRRWSPSGQSVWRVGCKALSAIHSSALAIGIS